MLYLLCGVVFLYVAIECGSSTWLGSYFETYYGIPAKSAAWRLSIYWCGMLTGRFTISILKPRWTMWPAAFVSCVGLLIAYIFMSFKSSSMTATFIIFIGATFSGPIWPVMVSISQKLRNTAIFTSFVIGSGALGAVAGPYLTSNLINYVGMKALFPVLAGSCLILFALILTAKFIVEYNAGTK